MQKGIKHAQRECQERVHSSHFAAAFLRLGKNPRKKYERGFDVKKTKSRPSSRLVEKNDVSRTGLRAGSRDRSTKSPCEGWTISQNKKRGWVDQI